MDADAAALRQLFNACAADQAGWHKNPMLIWQKLYDGVRDNDAGLKLLAEMQKLKDENTELRGKLKE